MDSLVLVCNFIMKIRCIVFCSKRFCIFDYGIHHIVETEALEVDFLEFSEDPQDFEEVVELAPCVEGSSEDTNFFMNQVKSRCI